MANLKSPASPDATSEGVPALAFRAGDDFVTFTPFEVEATLANRRKGMEYEYVHGSKTQFRRIAPAEGQPLPFSVGQRLFVRETFARCAPSEHSPNGVLYKADFKKRTYPRHREGAIRYLSPGKYERMDDATKWLRATQMPLAAVRIVLEVLEARIEPLRSITDDDARAESAWEWASETETRCSRACRYTRWIKPAATVALPVGCFAAYWDSVHSRSDDDGESTNGWRANPQVCVVRYKRLTPENEWNATKATEEASNAR